MERRNLNSNCAFVCLKENFFEWKFLWTMLPEREGTRLDVTLQEIHARLIECEFGDESSLYIINSAITRKLNGK